MQSNPPFDAKSNFWDMSWIHIHASINGEHATIFLPCVKHLK